MTTANDIVLGAIRQCSAATPGEAISGDEASNALTILNDMIGSWSGEGFMPPFPVEETFSLTQGQETWTIGPGANFSTARPDAIVSAFFTDTSAGIDYPYDIMTRDQYNAIALKSIAGIPHWLFYDPQYPNGIIKISQTAGTPNFTITLNSLKPIAQFANLSSTLTMPPEYTHAMKMLLADLLAFEYGWEMTQRQLQEVERCRAMIKARNAKREAAGFDSIFRKRHSFSVLTG